MVLPILQVYVRLLTGSQLTVTVFAPILENTGILGGSGNKVTLGFGGCDGTMPSSLDA